MQIADRKGIVALRYVLEQEREAKVRELGYLCYNISIGNGIKIPNTESIIYSMRSLGDEISRLPEQKREMYQKILNEYASELGRACFNMYVDKQAFSDQIMKLCSCISEINEEILRPVEKPIADEYKPPMPHIINDRPAERRANRESARSNDKSYDKNEFEMNLPYGMEPIPVHGKQCICGYRNREYAKYCGKCGAKL